MEEPLFPVRSTNTNASPEILVLHPYRESDGTWVFDDATVGLEREPFVGDVNRILDTLTEHIPNARQGFRLHFSAQPFPGQQATLSWVRTDPVEGNWYREDKTGIEGWLCPSLFHYFGVAPPQLHVRVEPIAE